MRLAPLLALLLCAPVLADQGEVERFLQPGEQLVRHLQTRSGNDVGITDRRLLIVAKQNLVEAHFLDDITHGLVHERGVSLRLNSGRILGLNVAMPQSAQAVVDLGRRASNADFQIQSGNRARLKPGFTVAEIERSLPPSTMIPTPPSDPVAASSGGIEPGPEPAPVEVAPGDSPLALINPGYLHLDLDTIGGLSAHMALRKEFTQVQLTLDPDKARLFATATVEKMIEADTRGTLLGKTKMKSFTAVVLVKVGNRNGDIYAADRKQFQVLGINPEHALSSTHQRNKLVGVIEGALVNYARARQASGTPFVLTKPFDGRR